MATLKRNVSTKYDLFRNTPTKKIKKLDPSLTTRSIYVTVVS